MLRNRALFAVRCCRVLALAILIGCGGSNPAASNQNDSAVNSYVQGLPAFAPPTADFDRATGPATVDRGTTQVCSTAPYSLSSTPKDVVMFNSDPQIMWPGALIVGNSYRDGSLQLLPISQRAPVKLSIQGVYANQTSATVEQPTGSTVTQAVNQLLSQAVKDQTVPTNSIFFTQASAYSLDQSLLKLGLSARYLGASAKTSLSVKTTTTESSVVAYALVRMFTVSVDPPATPADFFQGLTQQTLQQQQDQHRIGPDNVPVYVASVTYGQLMLFSATSTSSATELQAALSASFNGVAGGGSASISGAQKQLLQSSTIEISTLGGNGSAVRSSILNGTPADFFIGTNLITNAVPIGYTLKDLSGNVAKVAETSDYALTTCTQNGFANLYLANIDFGTGGAKVTGYYPDGSQAALNQPITNPTIVRGMAYDSLDDALFLVNATGGVLPFAPDGTPSHVVTATNPFAGLLNPMGIAYDPQRARLYVVGQANGDFGVVRAYTPQGDLLNLFFTPRQNVNAFALWSIAYDPEDQLIFVGGSNGSESDGFVTVFKFDGSDVTPAGGFTGLVLPEAVAWDSVDHRLYVADFFQGKVLAFDKDGAAVPLTHPIAGLSQPKGIVFDPVHNRLYVAVEGTSTMEVFEPDGTPVANLAVPAFPGLISPTAIALRP